MIARTSIWVAIASASVALSSVADGALITSYENAGGPPGSTYSTTTGVTNGAASLSISPGAGWTDTIIYMGADAATKLRANPLLLIDVTVPVGNPDGAWFNLQYVIQGDGLGWTTSPLVWSTSPSTLDKVTLSWDVSAIAIPENPSWFQIEVISQGNAARTLYFDNVRAGVDAVPEPTGLALAGVAAMGALLRRRGTSAS